MFEISYAKEYTLEPAELDGVESPPLTLDQSDPFVFPILMENPVRIDLTARDDTHVGVSLHNGEGQKVEQLINEIGPTNSMVLLQQEGEGFLFFDIEGPWSTEISEA